MEDRPKKKWQDKRPYKWTAHIVLTKPDGEIFDAIIAQYECVNASQLCKRIVRGELEIKPKERAD
jgi:hypothetical protein